jgi:hypothetical protein
VEVACLFLASVGKKGIEGDQARIEWSSRVCLDVVQRMTRSRELYTTRKCDAEREGMLLMDLPADSTPGEGGERNELEVAIVLWLHCDTLLTCRCIASHANMRLA